MGKRFTDEQLKKIKLIITNPEELDLLLDSDDPVRWAEKYFYDPDTGDHRLVIKKGFYPILRCNRRNRALRTGRQVGKCESEFTRITMADGSWPTAREVFEQYEDRPFELISTDNETFKHKKSIGYITDNGIKPLISITTKSGYTTTNTDNHPYLIWRDNSTAPEWIPGDEILPGDRIAVSRDLMICDSYKRYTSISPEEAELLGYLVGDSGTSQHTMKFTTANVELVDRINTILTKLCSNMELKKSHGIYDYHFVIKNKELYTPGPGNKSWITEFTQRNGIYGKLSKEKRIPNDIFIADNKVISSFLGAYWSTDGWIVEKNNGTEIGICSVSSELIKETRTLLLRFGIISRVYYKRVKYKGEIRYCWQLLIQDSLSIGLFKENINIRHELKASKLITCKLRNHNSNTDTIPKGIWVYVDKLIQKLGIKKQSLCYSQNNRIRYTYSPNMDKLSNQAISLNDSFISAVCTSDIMWDCVKNVRNAGTGQTYAITVPDDQNLITDNFITHNTVHLCVDIFHNLFFNKDYTILIFVPEKKNMNRMLEIMGNMIRRSDLKNAFSMGKVKKKDKEGLEAEYDYEIRCSSGSVCRFFFMANNPNKARGQHANGIIYIDEAEYLPEKAYDVIAGFPKADPNISICACSTPSGLPNTWFRIFSERCADPRNESGNEFHLPTSSEPNWAEIEPRLRDIIFDEVTWNLEVLALWTDALGAVYKKEVIDSAVARSMIYNQNLTMEELRNTLEYNNAPKFLGIDWNVPQNGVRLIELSVMFDRLFVTRHERISHELYTQTYTVERIIELFMQYRYKVISVDSGYGETQIELLHNRLIGLGFDPEKILNIIESVKKVKREIIYTSPDTGARKKDTIEMRTKTYIVSLLGNYLERNLAITSEEDESRTGLVSELRGFRRKDNKKEAGAFEYTDNTHSVSALQMAIHGYNEWYEKRNKQGVENITISAPIEINKLIKERINQQRIYGITINARINEGRRTGGLHGGTRRTII